MTRPRGSHTSLVLALTFGLSLSAIYFTEAMALVGSDVAYLARDRDHETRVHLVVRGSREVERIMSVEPTCECLVIDLRSEFPIDVLLGESLALNLRLDASKVVAGLVPGVLVTVAGASGEMVVYVSLVD